MGHQKNSVFTVNMQFLFEGKLEVNADNRDQAEEYVLKHCGLVLGKDIHSTLHPDDIDWDFPVHPDKVILSIHK